jgi:hypothetical protein
MKLTRQMFHSYQCRDAVSSFIKTRDTSFIVTDVLLDSCFVSVVHWFQYHYTITKATKHTEII